MRKACLRAVYDHAREDARIVFIGSDLGQGTLGEFCRDIPERFFMEGVSEANVVGMAAGLAMEGKIPYVNTIATFLTRRCFEQIVVDLCLHNVPVRLIGNGGGLVYAPLGPTHLAIEDIAILRPVPNMAILAPCDAEEMTRLVGASIEWPGPLYFRLAKGGDPIVTRGDLPTKIGEAVHFREGRDGVIMTTGVALQIAIEAADELAGCGLEFGILHLHTVKPLDRGAVLQRAGKVPVVLTVEEHVIEGGLGGAVAETIGEADFERPVRFRRIGLPDAFPDRYGNQAGLMARYGLTGEAVAKVARMLSRGVKANPSRST